MSVESFLKRRRIGLVTRIWASDSEEAAQRLKLLMKGVGRARQLTLGVNGPRLISHFDILVCNDHAYPQADYGLTFAALGQLIKNVSDINITNMAHGDPFAETLNLGIALQLRHRIDYSIIWSHDAEQLIREDVIVSLVEAMQQGAVVAGVAFDDQSDITETGRISNTCAMWENLSLMEVGGFDFHAQPSPNNTIGGVEEILPLLRLYNTFGSCIGVVSVLGALRTPVITNTDLANREALKKATREARQRDRFTTADTNFLTLEALRDAIMFRKTI